MDSEFWWKDELKGEDKPNTHEKVHTQMNSILTKQNYRYLEFLNYMRLYGQNDNLGYETGSLAAFNLGARPQINIIQICVNTLVSKIGKTAPRATFLTSEGDWGKQQQAKKLTQFSAGQFYKSKTYEQSKKSLLDACVTGSGFVKNYIRDNEIISERVMPIELLVDDQDGLYGTPRVLYQMKLVDKESLKAAHPNFEREIEECKSVGDMFGMTSFTSTNKVLAIEAWRLPSSKNAKDGRHFVGIANATFWYKEYKKIYFPFSKLVYENSLVGFWGSGVAKLVMGIQIELNRSIKAMSQSARLMGVPRVLYEYGSKMVKQHFNNEVGSMIGYSGTPPQFINPISIAADLMNWNQFLITQAFQEIGISQLSASGMKPAGLNSKVAMREYNDIETERFAAFAKNWEDFHMDIAKQQIDLAKELAKGKSEYGVWAKKRDGVEFIKWSDIDLEEDSYIQQAYPTSFLAGTPAGQLDRASDLIELGMLSPEQAGSLLEFPDVQEVMSMKNAPYNDIMYTIETLLEGKYVSPEPFQNLELGVTYVNSAYLKYKNKGVPEESLQLMRRWIDEALLLTTPDPKMEGDPGAIPDDPTAGMSQEDAQAALAQMGHEVPPVDPAMQQQPGVI
jgi:hypothetical protein